MNRYKGLIKNIITNQNQIISESKIGTVYNEGWSSWASQTGTTWTKRPSPTRLEQSHSLHLGQLENIDSIFTRDLGKLFLQSGLLKDSVKIVKLSDYCYQAFPAWFRFDSYYRPNLGLLLNFNQVLIKIDGLNSKYEDIILFGFPFGQCDREVEKIALDKIAKGKSWKELYEHTNEDLLEEYRQKFGWDVSFIATHLKQVINRDLNITWDNNFYNKIGIPLDGAAISFDEYAKDALIKNGYKQQVNELILKRDKEIEDCKENYKKEVIRIRKEQEERYGEVKLLSIYNGNWSFAIGEKRSKLKQLYKIDKMVDGKGKETSIIKNNQLPASLTIFSTFQFFENLPEILIEKMTAIINEVIGNGTREQYVWKPKNSNWQPNNYYHREQEEIILPIEIKKLTKYS